METYAIVYNSRIGRVVNITSDPDAVIDLLTVNGVWLYTVEREEKPTFAEASAYVRERMAVEGVKVVEG